MAPTNAHPVAPRDKALKINLDPRYYGTFAEIGAGQEVVRWFFLAGAAAGTIAKSISAYDMPTVRRIVRDAEGDDYRFAALVKGIVNSVPFRMRRAQSADAAVPETVARTE
jgi:hypothetical protein